MPENKLLPESQGELSSYQPTWRERASYWLGQHLFSDDREGVDKAKRLLNVVGMSGAMLPVDAYDAGRELGKGNLLTGGALTGMAALGALPGIRAWHGSPHSFERFALDRVGTGQKAQSFGHGLYFAENPSIAGNYQKTLSPAPKSEPERLLAWARQTSPDNPIGVLQENLKSVHTAGAPKTWRFVPSDAASRALATNQLSRDNIEAIKLAKAGATPGGHLYEVNIGARPEQLLDLDKELGSHETGKKLLAELPADFRGSLEDELEANGLAGDLSIYSGNEFQQLLRRVAGEGGLPNQESDWPRKAVSQYLQEAHNIPGNRYLDAGSRGLPEGQGTRNYVIWRDDILQVLKKFGLAGAVGGGAAANQLATMRNPDTGEPVR